MEWTASNTIALVAVLVTGVGAIVTVGVNAWLGNRRMGNDERMQDERLAHEKALQADRLEHERREALRTTAAAAYVKAGEVVRVLHPDRVGALRDDERHAVVSDALGELDVITAVGWTPQVRLAAASLGSAISALSNKAWATTELIAHSREDPDPGQFDSSTLGRAEAQLGEAHDGFMTRYHEYRVEISTRTSEDGE